MADAPRIALLVGGDDHRGQQWSEHLQLNNQGSTDVYRLADLPNEHSKLMQFTKGYFRQARRWVFDDYDLLINLITDADQHGTVVDILERALRGTRVPVLNHPSKVKATTREAVAKRLSGIPGLVVPRVRKVRSLSRQVLRPLAQSGALAFPAIVRRLGSHGGHVVGLLGSPDEELPQERSTDGFYLTEFVDFRSGDGLYRKYRVFLFGGTPMFRHMLISDQWNVHMADRERFMMSRPAVLAESQALYEHGIGSLPPETREVLSSVNARMGLDFFGIDFGILPDGRMVLFEANATMNFFPISDDPKLAAMKLCVPPARQAFGEMIEGALARRGRATA